MSGHSKWHSIKHKKAKEDAKRGNLFGKLSKSIIIAIKDGGGVSDPKDNITLANAIAKAKLEDLVLVPGISSALAKNILSFFGSYRKENVGDRG